MADGRRRLARGFLLANKTSFMEIFGGKKKTIFSRGFRLAESVEARRRLDGSFACFQNHF